MATSLLFRYLIQGVILTLWLATFPAKAQATFPFTINGVDLPYTLTMLSTSYEGAWRVKSIHLNAQVGHDRSAPELMGRRFKFNDLTITNNTVGASPCISPQALMWVGETNQLLESTMGLTGTDKPGKPATVGDFSLPLEGNEIIDAYLVTCVRGQVGPVSPAASSPLNAKNSSFWVTMLNNNEMAMKWSDDTILILHRENKRMRRR